MLKGIVKLNSAEKQDDVIFYSAAASQEKTLIEDNSSFSPITPQYSSSSVGFISNNSASKELYALISKCADSILGFTHIDIKKANELISAGADLCYCDDGKTIVQWLIISRQHELLKRILMLNPESCKVIPKYVKEFSSIGGSDEEILFRLGGHPLSLAAEAVRNCNSLENIEMYDLILMHYAESFIIAKGNSIINELYAIISNRIQETLNIQNGKPILIIFGEQHDSIFSGVAECVTMLVAANAGITVFFREEDYSRLKIFNQQHKDMEDGHYRNDGHEPHLLVRKMISKLKLDFFPADLGSDKYGNLLKKNHITHLWETVNESSITASGVKYRNNIMAQEYIKFSNTGIFSEVGSVHIYGLGTEQNLHNHFNILLLDSASNSKTDTLCDDEYSVRVFDYRGSSSVINLKQGILNAEALLMARPPNNLVEYIFGLSQAKYKFKLK